MCESMADRMLNWFFGMRGEGNGGLRRIVRRPERGPPAKVGGKSGFDLDEPALASVRMSALLLAVEMDRSDDCPFCSRLFANLLLRIDRSDGLGNPESLPGDLSRSSLAQRFLFPFMILYW